MKIIRRIWHKLIGIPSNKSVQTELSYVQKGVNSRLDSLSLTIRSENKNGRLVIGNDSVVSGSYVFENEHGKISIGNRTFIGGGCQFICIDGIDIGDDVMFSWGCTIMDNNAHSIIWEERKNDVVDWKRGLDERIPGKYKNWQTVKSKKITIKNKAWIGFNVIILKGVTIGERAVVAAGSVVTSDVPDDTVVAGNPAQVIKTIEQ